MDLPQEEVLLHQRREDTPLKFQSHLCWNDRFDGQPT